MGNSGSSGPASPLEQLKEHRDAMHAQQREATDRANECRRLARQQLSMKNRETALNHARQAALFDGQARTIGGIINNLDGQQAAIEKKQFMEDTMRVMAATARNLGTGALSAGNVEDLVDGNADLVDELNEVAQVLSVPPSALEDEEAEAILKALGNDDEVHITIDKEDNDEAFLEWARARVAGKEPSPPGDNLPTVPTHPIPSVKQPVRAPAMLM